MRLRTRQALWMGTATVLIILLVALPGVWLLRQNLKQSIDERVVNDAVRRRDRVADQLHFERERAALVASRTRLRRLIEQHLDRQLDATGLQDAAGPILQDAQRSSDSTVGVRVLDPAGRCVISTNPRDLNEDESASNLFTRGRDGFFYDLPREVEGQWVADVAVPCASNSGRPLGVVVLTVQNHALRAILSSASGHYESGRYDLVAQSGDDILLVLPTGESPTPQRIKAEASTLFRQATTGGAGLTRQAGDSGRYCLAAFAPVDYEGWVVIAKADEAEAYQPLFWMGVTTLATTAAGMATLILLAWLAAGRMTAPIINVKRAIDQLAGDHHDARVQIDGNDELADLARGFNRMADHLDVSQAALESEIAHRRQTEAKLRDTVGQLEQKTAEMEQFVYTVSHDLKSPLVSQLGFVDCLRESLEDVTNDDARTSLNYIERSAHRLYETVDDLLELSRIGRIPMRLERLALASLIAEVGDEMRPRFDEAGVRLELYDGSASIDADAKRMRQVLENLLTNALKYGSQPSDGSEPVVRVGVEVEGDETRLYVRDNGPGIDPQYHEKVFDLFQRLDTSDEGTGVGLTNVHRVAQVMGGRAWVESQVGRGATFWIALPRSAAGREPLAA